MARSRSALLLICLGRLMLHHLHHLHAFLHGGLAVLHRLRALALRIVLVYYVEERNNAIQRKVHVAQGIDRLVQNIAEILLNQFEMAEDSMLDFWRKRRQEVIEFGIHREPYGADSWIRNISVAW